MENFIAHNPTKLHFGRNVLDNLGETVIKYGKKVLLMYGKGSVKRNGSYDKTMEQLKMINASILEYSGIKPNPLVDDVDKATQIAIENNIDLIIGLGGGSVIDSAKIVAICAKERRPAWDIMKQKVIPTSSLPLICILTLAATGTEMNGNAVLQNHQVNEKAGFSSPLAYPVESFIDPIFTYDVTPDHTAYGIVDLIAHTLESFFGHGEASLSDKFVVSIIKEAIENAPKVLDEPNNYDYRANIFWASTMALNGTTFYGKSTGDWGVHDIAHNISYLFDTPHGATLSIVYPAWLKHHMSKLAKRIMYLGENIFNVESAEKTIHEFEQFFSSINCPIRLRDIGLSLKDKDELLKFLNKNKAGGMAHNLTNEDREHIAELML